MDADLAVLLRFLERMLAVAIGGLAIYLGYRLFILIPVSKDGEARLNIAKDFSIVLSRVGPGVFFALFGAFVTGISLYKSVVVNVQPEQITIFQGAGGVGTTTEDAARADTRMRLKREIAVLNTLSKLLDPALPPHERAHVELAIPRIKLALMKPVWGEAAAGWGTPEAFEQWQKENDGGPPPAEITEAVKYFNYPERGDP